MQMLVDIVMIVHKNKYHGYFKRFKHSDHPDHHPDYPDKHPCDPPAHPCDNPVKEVLKYCITPGE